ncbi:MAG TPA: PQQ-dependent sugar dehydrogenase [Burkholderiaceae bacterium]|nr:PQQ-dependent sugar dehydrogenase [Burkholderiaceae bacterium]
MHRSRIRICLALAAGTYMTTACGGGGDGGGTTSTPPSSAAPAPAPASGLPSVSRSVVLSDLRNPWDIAFAPDGAMFFTERGKGLSVRRPNGTVQRLFGGSGAAVVASDFLAENQAGFCGVAVDPDFANNRTLYVYMASTAGGKNNRVVRLTVDNGYTTVSNRTDIVTGITYKVDPPPPGQLTGTGAHNGGRLRFGPDGYLYVTTGDTHNANVPQSKTQLGGKVLRVDRDGRAAPGNNAPAGYDARIYAYGFRNPQGIAFRPSTGQAYTSEHGPGHSDEVTPLSPGGNAGWDPGCADGSYCGYTSNQADGSPTPMTDLAKFPNAMRPIWNNQGRSQGMGGNAFLKGSAWKDWDGALAVTYMAGTRVQILTLDSTGGVSGTATLPSLESSVRIRSATLGPDSNLYLTTDGRNGGDQIWKITPR